MRQPPAAKFMNEREWLTSDDPQAMLQVLTAKDSAYSHRAGEPDRPASDRKLRLFACACWRSEPNRQGRWNEFLDAVREHEEILEGRKLEYSARALGWVCARY